VTPTSIPRSAVFPFGLTPWLGVDMGEEDADVGMETILPDTNRKRSRRPFDYFEKPVGAPIIPVTTAFTTAAR
jgi:hypothetical protein